MATKSKKKKTKKDEYSPIGGDFNFDYTNDEGVRLRETLAIEELTKGAWATVATKFVDIDAKTGERSAPKYAVVRYQKKDGVYKKRSNFNISSAKQGEKIVGILTEWMEEDSE